MPEEEPDPQGELEPHTLGGQAVLEGVMMRSPRWWALAVRQPDHAIHVESHEVTTRGPLASRPAVRGVLALVDSLSIGIRALSTSARVSMGSDEAPTKREMGMAIAIAVVFFVALFIVLPAVFVRGGAGAGGPTAFLHNLREGLVRIGIFLAYILLVARLSDIRRVFEYHGAEHKVIAAHEAGAARTVQGARPFSTIHVRCGTDFLFLVMLLAVLVFSLVGRPPLGWRILSRIVLLPVVAALSYELLRLAARHEANPLVRLVTWPGRALQRITTREPDDDQIDVALAALEELLRCERTAGEPRPPTAA